MQRTTPVVLNLIIINALVWIAQISLTSFNITEWGSLHYFSSPNFKPHQLVTNMFLHDTGGIGHLLFNMFGLWMFGSVLENFWGSQRFLIFYLVCGLGASLLTELMVPFSAGQFASSATGLRMAAENAVNKQVIIDWYQQTTSALGASGAIMGVMAAFAYLFPNTEMFVMMIPVPVKAKFVIPVLVLIDLFGGLNPGQGDNVAHFAHLGGAIVGFVLVLIWNKNRKRFY